MDIADFARFVGLDARDLQREAERGLLPGRKIGGQWRFNQIQVHQWLNQHMLTSDPKRLAAFEAARDRQADTSQLMVTNLMGVESIELTFSARTKASVLRELVRLAERTAMVYDAPGLIEALEKREEQGSTAMPNGLAIPHPELPMPYATAEPLICVARSLSGIPFGAPNGSLTWLFVLICKHDRDKHLHVLARLMRMFTPELIQGLLNMDKPSDALKLLITREKAVVAESSQPA